MGLSETMKIKRGPLDVMFSKIIRTRDNWECQRCVMLAAMNNPKKTEDVILVTSYVNRPGGLHCAHLNSRRHLGLRWEEDNACALDFGCHQYLDSHPIEKIAFFKARVGEKRFEEMYLRSKIPCRVDESAVLLRLRVRLKELGE